MSRERDDPVAAWLKERRDALISPAETPSRFLIGWWYAIDHLLDEYRLRADYGLTLDEELPEGIM